MVNDKTQGKIISDYIVMSVVQLPSQKTIRFLFAMNEHHVRFPVLMAASMKMTAFWHTAPQ
jgi:hypothetical protein